MLGGSRKEARGALRHGAMRLSTDLQRLRAHGGCPWHRLGEGGLGTYGLLDVTFRLGCQT